MAAGLWMEKDVLLQFKLNLREQQHALQQAIGTVEQELRAAMDSTADHLDLSTGNALRESMASRNSQNRLRLRTIEIALERIQKGSFGTCVACDGAIGLKRLQAIPSATRCIRCQERLEQGIPDAIPSSNPAPDACHPRNDVG
jgi:DnaK suppressor protein